MDSDQSKISQDLPLSEKKTDIKNNQVIRSLVATKSKLVVYIAVFLGFLLLVIIVGFKLLSNLTKTPVSNQSQQQNPISSLPTIERYVSPLGFSFINRGGWKIKEETFDFDYYNKTQKSVYMDKKLIKATDKNSASTIIHTGQDYFDIYVVKNDATSSNMDKNISFEDYIKITHSIFSRDYFSLFDNPLMKLVEEIYSGKRKVSDPIYVTDEEGKEREMSSFFRESGDLHKSSVQSYKNKNVWGLTCFETGNTTGDEKLYASKKYYLFDTDKKFFMIVSYPLNQCTDKFYNEYQDKKYEFYNYWEALKAALPGCDQNSEYKQQVDDFISVLEFDQADNKFSITNDSLVGIWQDYYVLPSGWQDRYQFYKSGTYAHIKPEGSCESRDIGELGTWKLSGNYLMLTIVAQIYFEDFDSEYPEIYGCSGSVTKYNLLTPPQKREFKILSNPDQPEPDFHYPSIYIGDIAFWRFNNDLKDEPPFPGLELGVCSPDNEPCLPEK